MFATRLAILSVFSQAKIEADFVSSVRFHANLGRDSNNDVSEDAVQAIILNLECRSSISRFNNLI
jgi:hypothetical protein